MTKIIIAMHKPYQVPTDELYLPLHVGAEGKAPLWDGVTGDDTGDNISGKNATYCELTGLYWAWKNLDADAIGLVHYRRYFKGKGRGAKIQRVLSGAEAEKLMAEYDIVVPAKRNYYIETLYTHYSHTLDNKHLDLARDIIHKQCPDYDGACVAGYTHTWGHMFNMCIMRRDLLDDYCRWLFPILEELERELCDEVAQMSAFEARLYGRVSEILFNVWIAYQRQNHPEIRIKEVPTIHMEKVNWFKKGSAFLMAKFFGKKYDASF